MEVKLGNGLGGSEGVSEGEQTDSLAAVVLAAGLSKRMKSRTIKVLHPLCGKPAVLHLLASLQEAGFRRVILVVGHQREEVERVVGSRAEYVVQEELLGTGDAVRRAVPVLPPEGTVLVTYGDTVLYRAETFRQLVAFHLQTGASATLLSAELVDPTGYGRIVRDENGAFRKIVEERDALPAEKAIREINTGTYCFHVPDLVAALAEISPGNAQGEYYLTDTLGWLSARGRRVEVLPLADPEEALGFNDRVQLALAERVLRDRIRRRWMAAGVTLVDPAAIYIDPEVEIGPDTIIEPGSWLVGKTHVGAGCHLGPWVYLEDARIADGSRLAFCRCLGEGPAEALIEKVR